MKLLKELQQRANFSSAEQKIIQYMMDNSKEVIDLSIRDLSQRTYTSSSAIFRLCRKCGVKGYTEFRIKFISEINRTADFLRIGKPAVANLAANMQVGQAIASTPQHIAFILSRTGENKKLVRIVKILRKKGIVSVVFTSNQLSSLAKLFNIFIYVSNSEEFVNLGSLIYGAGVKYILDVLFSILLAREYENVLYLADRDVKVTA